MCLLGQDFDGMPVIEACLAVDFCVDLAGGMNNNEAAYFECQHPCNTGDSESQAEAGCHGDGMGNAHDDQVCVVEQVWAPGEDMWGQPCCSWCGDNDGDGTPDYEGCCTGMRTDGEMGCEYSYCRFMCNGLDCSGHEDQATCEDNGGLWTVTNTCMGAIEEQRDYVVGRPEGDAAAAFWLAEHGTTCCQMDAKSVTLCLSTSSSRSGCKTRM